jgi:hypothetical protein
VGNVSSAAGTNALKVRSGPGETAKEQSIMNRYLWVCLPALAIVAFSGRTYADYKVDCGCSPRFNVCSNGGQYGTGGCGGCFQAGPWYTYWPYQAHFQIPSPLGFPFWPGPTAAAGPQFLPPAPPPPGPPGTPMPPRTGGFQPVGYDYSSFQPAGAYYYGQAPSYWYGR